MAWSSRYNVAPTQMMPVIRGSEGSKEAGAARQLDLLRWGLVPSWAKDVKIGAKMINARSETVCQKPAFRSAVSRRRCLVPADGFFEWKKLAGGGKQPYCIRMRGGSLFAFAGIWERWEGNLEPEMGLFSGDLGGDAPGDVPGDVPGVESFTILTTRPNGLVGSIHDRMPVILDSSDFGRWLDSEVTEASDVESLVGEVAEPFAAGQMEAYPISPRMNRVAFDEPSVLEPLPDTE